MADNSTLCILRLSAIGDVCHALAMVSLIQRKRPDIDITWVIGKVEYQLVKHLPNIRFVVFDKKAGKSALSKLKNDLSDTTFDALFVMQVALRANIVSRMIKAKKRIGFDFSRAKEGHSLFINQRISKQTHPHVLDGFLAFAQAIGIEKDDTPTWDLPIPDSDQEWLEQTLPEQYVVISPAASKEERNWTPDGYAQCIDYLHSRGLKVVLCGGPGPLDKNISADISALTENISLNLVACTTLTQLLAVLKHAMFVIAPDTGPAHMATTQGTPVIGLYAHSNPRRTGPYLSLDRTVSVYDECILQQKGKAWSSLPWGIRAKGKDLMQNIKFEELARKIDEFL